jgi:hypothetical protein
LVFLPLLLSQLYLYFFLDYVYDYSTYGINGAYRPVVLRPSDLKWKFVHYDNPDQKLIPSDLDRLEQVGSPPVSSQGIFHVSLSIALCPYACSMFIQRNVYLHKRFEDTKYQNILLNLL